MDDGKEGLLLSLREIGTLRVVKNVENIDFLCIKAKNYYVYLAKNKLWHL